MSRSLSVRQAFFLGIVVLACVIAGGWSLLRIGNRNGFWDESFEVVMYVPNAQDLDRGTPVKIRGVEAGQVIALEDSDQDGDEAMVRVRIKLHQKYRDRLFADASATVSSKGIFSSSTVAVLPGHPEAGPLADNVIRYRPQQDLSERAVAVLDRAESIVRKVEQGQGTAGKLLTDDSLYQEVTAGVGEIRTLIRNSNQLITNTNEAVTSLKTDAQKTLQGVNKSLDAVQSEVAGVKEFVRSGQEAIVAIKQDAEAIKSMPIIRSYVEDSVKLLVRPNMNRDRVFYVEEDLFESNRAVLSAQGRERLQKVADWLNSNKNKGSDVVVVSFADPNNKEHTSSSARELSKKQSEVVATFLRDKGVHKMGTFSRRDVTPLGMGFDPSPIVEKERLPVQRTEIILFVP